MSLNFFNSWSFKPKNYTVIILVKILSSNAKGTGSTPGQGIKVLHAVGCNEKFLLKLFLTTTKSEPPSTLF